MPEEEITPNSTNATHSATSSRRKLLGATALTGVLAISATGIARAFGQQDHDDDDDRDHSHDEDETHSDNDDDRDHSGHDEDDDHDDDHENDDDQGDVEIEGDIPDGSVVIHIVDDDSNGFSPSEVTIEAGQVITFANADDEAHTATGLEFDTGIMQPGETASVEFTEPGTFPYACEIHPEMTGVITVAGGVATPEIATPATNDLHLVVAIENIAFNPEVVTIPVGATVAWENLDPVAHTSTGDSFDTGPLDQGQSGTVTFTEAGEFPYVCAFHPNMTGTVIVEQV